jgi:hypothetical protein
MQKNVLLTKKMHFVCFWQTAPSFIIRIIKPFSTEPKPDEDSAMAPENNMKGQGFQSLSTGTGTDGGSAGETDDNKG